MARALAVLLAATTSLIAVTSCGSSTPDKAAGRPASCSPGALPTLSKGALTVVTDDPAYPPWYIDDKPSSGKGYESAVAYAVAEQLGYPAAKVDWKVASFDSIVQLGPKKFDVDANEVSITPARKKAVDFSSGYYDVTQAIVALKGSRIAAATSIADLKDAKLGAQLSSTSYDTITDVIKPANKPAAYNTNDIAKQTLKNKQIDGLVVDLPTAFELESEISGSTIVGQIPSSGPKEQFGLVLGKDSPLTSCVTKAVNTLRSNGTLAKLQQKWLSGDAGAPVLK